MDWIQVLTIIFAVFGMFLWNRKETRDETREIRQAVYDFHGRLCALEEKYRQMEKK